MKPSIRLAALFSCLAPLCCAAAEPTNCFAAEVYEHVWQQFLIYGPLSRDTEYFGYVYRLDGVIASATTQGGHCYWNQNCEVKTATAAAKIPPRSKVLGEWHTHPHNTGALNLSDADVRGANANRRIRCYRAFFSTADADIYSWDVTSTGVMAAMRSRSKLGNYRHSREGQEAYASTAP